MSSPGISPKSPAIGTRRRVIRIVGNPSTGLTVALGKWLDSQAIIDRSLDSLFPAEVVLRGLNRDVAKQELNLIQFASGRMIKSRATTPKIMRSQSGDAGSSRILADDMPHHPLGHPGSPNGSGFRHSSKELSCLDHPRLRPLVEWHLDPIGYGNRANMTSFPMEVYNCPVILPLLKVADLQGNCLMAP